MKKYRGFLAGYISAFFILVLLVAIAFRPQYSALVFIGESSVGTWLSGVLLIISSTVSLVLCLKTEKKEWILIATFFFVLALDERFMFHERTKEYIIFWLQSPSVLIYELPVLIGTCFGFWIAFILWNLIEGQNRFLLLLSILAGLNSVIFDIFSKGVIIEECSKLLAELFLVCSLCSKLEKELKEKPN